MNVCVRGIREDVFRQFKAESIREGKKMGEAVNEALNLWLRENQPTQTKRRLCELKPVHFGPGTENLSREIDELVYGIR